MSLQLPEGDLRAIRERGFEPGEAINEGRTRVSVRAVQHLTGDVTRPAIGLLPKERVDKTVRTLINTYGRDVNENEARVLASVSHPNIVTLYACIPGTYGLMTFEEDFGGMDLERRVKERPFAQEQFSSIVRQGLSAISYAHRRNIVHRDIKAANFVMNDEGVLKLADWQNARHLDDIASKMLPTAGATSHTMPSLLNDLVAGRPASADKRNDIYAFGVTLYQCATGRLPFGYELAIADDGKALVDASDFPLLSEDGTQVRVALRSNGRTVQSISAADHERTLEGALDALPKQFERYRRVMHRALTLSDSAYSDVGEMIKDVEIAERPSFSKRHWRPIAASLLAGALLSGVAVVGGISMLPTPTKRALFEDQAGKLPISVYMNPDGSYGNNVIDARVSVSYDGADGMRQMVSAETPFVHLASGGADISVALYAKVKPEVDSMRAAGMVPDLSGRAYIEGVPGFTTISVEPKHKQDNEIMWDNWELKVGRTDFTYKVPPGLGDGIYTFAIEIYSPTWQEIVRQGLTEENLLRVEEGSSVIWRMPVPLAVGGVPPVAVERISYDQTDLRIYVGNPVPAEDLLDEAMTYRAALIDDGVFGMRKKDLPVHVLGSRMPPRDSERYSFPGTLTDRSGETFEFSIPPGGRYSLSPELRFLEITARSGSGTWANWIPMEVRCSDCSDPKLFSYEWRPGIPPRDYAERLVAFRDALAPSSPRR